MEDKIYNALYDCYLLLTGQGFEDSKKKPYEVLQETINTLNDALENYEDYLPDALGTLTEREEVTNKQHFEDGEVCPFCLVTVQDGSCICLGYADGEEFLKRS